VNETPRLVLVGVSHRGVPLEVRERFHLAPPVAGELSARLAGADGEAVVLSTCNRTELYLVGNDVDELVSAASRELACVTGMSEPQLHATVTLLVDRDAAAHLFAVAGGLESMIVGDSEIVAQIQAARRAARAAGCSGTILTRLFDHAINAGRRVRSAVQLGELPASLPATTARLAQEAFGPLGTATAVVIGAGRMSELVLSAFKRAGVGRTIVVNRTVGHAQELAARFGAELVDIGGLEHALGQADIVISCTSSPELVVDAAMLRRARASRAEQAVLLDLAVPRDLDPAIAELDGCRLYNVDELARVVAATRSERRRELARARAIVEEEADRFREWQCALEVVPAIASLRRFAEKIREVELARIDGALRRLPPAERLQVESLTVQIVNRFLHEPTVRMKRAATGQERRAYADAVQCLFASDEEAA